MNPNKFRTFVLCLFAFVAINNGYADPPDSVYIKAFTTGKNDHKNGLHIAYSTDQIVWTTIGGEFAFLKSDYGPWGSDKRMLNPILKREKEQWTCHFGVNETDNIQGFTVSTDLIHWKPQDYILGGLDRNALTKEETVFKVSWTFVENLINHAKWVASKNQLYAETTAQDSERFAHLKPVSIKITPDFSKPKKISDKLIGVFFEDINYAADGGLYAELLQNRDFEYSAKDQKEWNATTAWTSVATKRAPSLRIDTANPLHPNNPHYLVLEDGQTIVNEGWDGIPLTKGEKYDFSVFAKAEKRGEIIVKLIDNEGNILSNELSINVNSKNWKKYSAVLTANQTLPNAKLSILHFQLSTFNFPLSICVDLFSLFPQKTFKNRQNGLRADLAQAIADLNPKFIRFPGGCVAHGNGIDNIYHWKESIGRLEERKPDFNLWGYYQTKGLGCFEYFQFCEDIGAEPVPIVAAGVPCQNSKKHNHALAGQQGGIPLGEMDAYIQDILDLIEWANGDAKTTKWGKLRAESGHPAPFRLKYIGIGNEDLISEVFKERFSMIFNAIKQKHPEITLIGTVGPFYEGSDYDEGWRFASGLGVPVVDEHYYVPPGWMLYNHDFYDRYDRSKPQVYLGEYAAHLPGRPNNLETALAEAVLLCNVERNADVVTMTSYAPLLAKERHTQWNPDLIYFNNSEVQPTVGYQVQKLFGNNAGDKYIPATVEIANNNEKVHARFASSILKDTQTGEMIIKLVNLLPVESNIELQGFGNSNLKVEKSVLTGNPNDKTAQSTMENIELQDNKVILPNYSLTILRVKK